MGHTKIPFTMQFQREEQHFTAMRRGLLLARDRQLFASLFEKAAFHIPACEQAAHPLPVVSMLLAIHLEQAKAIDSLQTSVEGLQRDLDKLAVENKALRKTMFELEDTLEERLNVLRAELLEIKYPAYVE